MTISYLPLSWKRYLNQIYALSEKILALPQKPDEIVAISRGGLTLGHLLADQLHIPIWTISIQSYTDIQTQGEVKIIGKLQTSIKNKHILLVDDVSDTGKTFVRAIQYLKHFHPSQITSCAVFHKPHSVYTPDIYIDETSKWILFPYETTESIQQIVIKLQKEGKTKQTIVTTLRQLKFAEHQIDFVYRHYIKEEKKR